MHQRVIEHKDKSSDRRQGKTAKPRAQEGRVQDRCRRAQEQRPGSDVEQRATAMRCPQENNKQLDQKEGTNHRVGEMKGGKVNYELPEYLASKVT
ncbi:hypothetical protein M405DRAFT_637428 [Rhizopogon salebrosus TDB-379]|nr:hypothetical protein M405DRAFT_637428 [Rhizopogon salebrosus TDB-379]